MSGSFFTSIELEVMAKLANACRQLNNNLQENDSILSIEWLVRDDEGVVASQADDILSDRVFIHGQDD